MNGFEGLIKWLHGAAPMGYTPQLGMAGASKTALCWIPGRARKPAGVTVDSSAVVYLGSTNRAYPSPYEPMDSQPSAITWAGIDIDWADQSPDLFRSPEKLAEAVLDCISDDQGPMGSIRWSCGGRGLHVLFRLSAPVPVCAHPVRGAHTAITRRILRPFHAELTRRGIYVCQWDSRMFWLWGGKNDWASQTDRLLRVDTALAAAVPAESERKPGAADLGWVASDPFVSGWLERLQARPGLCYVGTIIHKLRALGERVNTVSKMSGDGRPNGYLDVAPGRIGLWTYADGGTIWCDEDLDRTLAAMGFESGDTDE